MGTWNPNVTVIQEYSIDGGTIANSTFATVRSANTVVKGDEKGRWNIARGKWKSPFSAYPVFHIEKRGIGLKAGKEMKPLFTKHSEMMNEKRRLYCKTILNDTYL